MATNPALALIAAVVGSSAEDAEPFRPTTSGPFVTYTAPITPAGRAVLQPIVTATFARGAFAGDGSVVPLPAGDASNLQTLSVFVELGITDAIAVGGQPAVGRASKREGGAAAASVGFADTLLFGRGVLVRERAGWIPELTLLVQTKLPTGKHEGARSDALGTDIFGTGSVDLTAGIDVTKGIRPVVVHADFFVTHPLPASIDGVTVRYGDSLSWSASVEWPFAEHFALMAEVSGRHQADGDRPGTAEILVGAGLEVIFSERLQVLVGLQRTVAGMNVPANDSLIATLVPLL